MGFAFVRAKKTGRQNLGPVADSTPLRRRGVEE
jgi:hypothetical protein